MSAQESRRKKKEYIDGLESRYCRIRFCEVILADKSNDRLRFVEILCMFIKARLLIEAKNFRGN